MGIHSTILIDKDGRVHWAQHGGAPFDDFKFLVSQLQRMNQRHAAAERHDRAQPSDDRPVRTAQPDAGVARSSVGSSCYSSSS